MKIVIISDTHNKHKGVKIPEGDVIIHAGDMSSMGRHHEIRNFCDWLMKLDFKHKIIVPGNHDFFFERNLDNMIRDAVPEPIKYLINEYVEIDGIKIWGSPITPKFCDWAYMMDDDLIGEHWKKIPEGIDILVTHGPPYGILDNCRNGQRVGCKKLLDRIKIVKPKYHIFGHIHDGYGIETHGETTFINVSVLDDEYIMTNEAAVLEI